MTKSSILSRGLLFLLVLNIGPNPGLAAPMPDQTAVAGFTGLIVDREGVGIPDASILIEDNNRSWNLRSDRTGEFKVGLPGASYRFTIERIGFKKLIEDDFVIKGGSPVTHSFLMGIENPICTVFIKPANFSGTLPIAAAPEPQPNIGVAGYYASNKAQRGKTIQAAIVIDIPSGYHINSSRPLESYLIATQLKIDASGARVGSIAYPPAKMRTFKFSKKSLSVYENKAILRFTVTVPANYQGNDLALKAHLRYQSCNDEVCFPPKNQDVNMSIDVVGANDRVQRTNGWAFGGK